MIFNPKRSHSSPKTWNQTWTIIQIFVLGHEEPYFANGYSDSISKYTEDDIIKMLKFPVDNIFVVSAGNFPKIVGIVPLYSYETEYIKFSLSTGKGVRI